MSIDVAQLEQAWLKAETAADEAKHAAMRLTAELARRRQNRFDEGQEQGVLKITVEELKARQEEAERTASAAFDRYWLAKSGDGRKEPGSAYTSARTEFGREDAAWGREERRGDA